jgi:4-aminobutyrate aminotransferase
VEHAAFQRGLMVLTAGDDVVRISPPLVITEREAAAGCRVFAEAVAAVAGR